MARYDNGRGGTTAWPETAMIWTNKREALAYARKHGGRAVRVSAASIHRTGKGRYYAVDMDRKNSLKMNPVRRPAKRLKSTGWMKAKAVKLTRRGGKVSVEVKR